VVVQTVNLSGSFPPLVPLIGGDGVTPWGGTAVAASVPSVRIPSSRCPGPARAFSSCTPLECAAGLFPTEACGCRSVGDQRAAGALSHCVVWLVSFNSLKTTAASGFGPPANGSTGARHRFSCTGWELVHPYIRHGCVLSCLCARSVAPERGVASATVCCYLLRDHGAPARRGVEVVLRKAIR